MIPGKLEDHLESEPFPKPLTGGPHFALTSFDPPGVERSLEENTAMNNKMAIRLSSLKNPKPIHIYPSFGYSITEKWREDGFVVAFLPEDVDAARMAIVDIAKEFDQGAIFEYAASEDDDRFLRRTTVPALSKEEPEEVLMVRIAAPEPGNEMLDRPWAGPIDSVTTSLSA